MIKHLSILLILSISCLLTSSAPPGFKNEQLRYPRVREAFNDKESSSLQTLRSKNIQPEQLQIMLLAYKKEQALELWAKNTSSQEHQLIRTYHFCSFSGSLGPKRRQGDRQIPEGLYYIDRFNPNSNFFLSLGINYPNKSDQILSQASDKGGDIFIHGGCVTIGCIPITDNYIKELYAYAVIAKDQGQEKIPVAIFPSRMTKENMDDLLSKESSNKALRSFWQNLKSCYDKIMMEKRIPPYSIDAAGKYVMK